MEGEKTYRSGSAPSTSQGSSLYKMLSESACTYQHGEMAFIECLLHTEPKVFSALTKEMFSFSWYFCNQKRTVQLFELKKKVNIRFRAAKFGLGNFALTSTSLSFLSVK